jgi:hypothetical protein
MISAGFIWRSRVCSMSPQHRLTGVAAVRLGAATAPGSMVIHNSPYGMRLVDPLVVRRIQAVLHVGLAALNVGTLARLPVRQLVGVFRPDKTTARLPDRLAA